MPENKVYEYVVIRVVPRVHREEFVNVGVMLFCAADSFLGVKTHIDERKLKALSPDLDLQELACYLKAMGSAANGNGRLGLLSLGERFRWLSATKSAIVQCGKVHPGILSGLPEEKLHHIFEEMVL